MNENIVSEPYNWDREERRVHRVFLSISEFITAELTKEGGPTAFKFMTRPNGGGGIVMENAE